MLNRFISMNMDILPIINEFQKYTIGTLDNREVYKLYFDILPKSRMFFKYVKGNKDEKYNSELIKYVSLYLKCPSNESEEYLNLIYKLPNKTELLEQFLGMYGLNEKEIKKLL